MITKGTEDYKKAQNLANLLQEVSQFNSWHNKSSFDLMYDDFYSTIERVKRLDVFASKIAETVQSKMSAFGKQIAYLSSKQSWILACAIIENKLETELK